jgi:competence protein ComEC
MMWLWRRSTRLTLLFPAKHAGASAALITAFIYSALAGFSLPTQRACIMLSVGIMVLLSKRKINIWHSWSLALLLVLIINPLSIVTESFCLSFSTIALIIYGMQGRLCMHGIWWKWGRVQWVIGIGLMPLSLYLFQECSLISFVANTLAIPWLGFLILPFCFLSSMLIGIFPACSVLLLMIANKNLGLLWSILSSLSHLSFATWQYSMPNHFILILSLFAIILLLVPAGMPGRWLGLVGLFPFIFYQPLEPQAGSVWLTMLDVGQGLSLVVQTQHHVLVYDAGPRYDANNDMGERVVLPYLRTLHLKKIDMLVVSHGDNDHIGGAFSLLKSLPVFSIKTSVPKAIVTPFTSYCLAGESWEWDQVHFSFIYPAKEQLNMRNDSSCVLRIDNGEKTILLTGDIEKQAEKNLIQTVYPLLHADIISAPHHGSQTSGLKSFIEAVHPTFVLYGTGYDNRYHFPHRTTVAAYKNLAATQLNTAQTGAIQFKINKGQNVLNADLYRVQHARYWFHKALLSSA